jgi:hypothetical protein
MKLIQLMLFRKVIAVYSENQLKLRLSMDEMPQFVILNQAGYMITAAH